MVVGLADLVAWRGPPASDLVWGPVDEAGHAALGLLLAAALLREPARRQLAVVVAASVLLDLDHLPQILFDSTVLQGTAPRPYPHTVAGVLLVLAVALAARAAPRTVALIGAGLAIHLFRDAAVPLGGPGLELAWPLSREVLVLPYGVYAAGVLVLVAAASIRSNRAW